MDAAEVPGRWRQVPAALHGQQRQQLQHPDHHVDQMQPLHSPGIRLSGATVNHLKLGLLYSLFLSLCFFHYVLNVWLTDAMQLILVAESQYDILVLKLIFVHCNLIHCLSGKTEASAQCFSPSSRKTTWTNTETLQWLNERDKKKKIILTWRNNSKQNRNTHFHSVESREL